MNIIQNLADTSPIFNKLAQRGNIVTRTDLPSISFAAVKVVGPAPTSTLSGQINWAQFQVAVSTQLLQARIEACIFDDTSIPVLCPAVLDVPQDASLESFQAQVDLMEGPCDLVVAGADAYANFSASTFGSLVLGDDAAGSYAQVCTHPGVDPNTVYFLNIAEILLTYDSLKSFSFVESADAPETEALYRFVATLKHKHALPGKHRAVKFVGQVLEEPADGNEANATHSYGLTLG